MHAQVGHTCALHTQHEFTSLCQMFYPRQNMGRQMAQEKQLAGGNTCWQMKVVHGRKRVVVRGKGEITCSQPRRAQHLQNGRAHTSRCTACCASGFESQGGLPRRRTHARAAHKPATPHSEHTEGSALQGLMLSALSKRPTGTRKQTVRGGRPRT